LRILIKFLKPRTVAEAWELLAKEGLLVDYAQVWRHVKRSLDSGLLEAREEGRRAVYALTDLGLAYLLASGALKPSDLVPEPLRPYAKEAPDPLLALLVGDPKLWAKLSALKGLADSGDLPPKGLLADLEPALERALKEGRRLLEWLRTSLKGGGAG